MQEINYILKRLANNENFQKRYEMTRRQVLQDPYVKAFLQENEAVITSEMVDKGLSKLYDYSKESKECELCESLEACKNMIPGFQPHLVIRQNSIDVSYERCPKKIMNDKRREHERLIESLYVPKEVLKASLGDIELDQGRFMAIKHAKDFVEEYTPDGKHKGLYLYGAFGTGKSYILGAIANELAKRGVSSMLVYVPEFLREMKGSIGDHTVNEKLDIIKKAPVLMLDDIGAETMSSWVRDEILGTILQFRMMENLPTFFTSNFNFNQLEHHLTYSQRGEEEKMKAGRIMERIKYLALPLEVSGPNRRES